MARWNEMAFGQPRAHHEPGCTGHCEGECQREFMALFCAAYSREGQAPVTSEEAAPVDFFAEMPTVKVQTPSEAEMVERMQQKRGCR